MAAGLSLHLIIRTGQASHSAEHAPHCGWLAGREVAPVALPVDLVALFGSADRMEEVNEEVKELPENEKAVGRGPWILC